MSDHAEGAGKGIPPGLVGAVLEVLQRSKAPVRRREILAELERSGHRVSLAGLNRALQYSRESGLTQETESGLTLAEPTKVRP